MTYSAHWALGGWEIRCTTLSGVVITIGFGASLEQALQSAREAGSDLKVSIVLQVLK